MFPNRNEWHDTMQVPYVHRPEIDLTKLEPNPMPKWERRFTTLRFAAAIVLLLAALVLYVKH